MDLKLASKTAELNAMAADMGELAANEAECKALVQALGTNLALAQQKLRDTTQDALVLTKQLKGAQQLVTDNDRLKGLVRKKQTELEELRTATAKQRGEFNKIRKERADVETKRAELIKICTEQQDYIKELSQRLNYTDETTPVFPAEDGTNWYFHTFGWGLVSKMADRPLINVDWHIEMRDNAGNGALVMIDENLEPVLPLNERTASIPMAAIKAVKNTLLARCQESHPELHARRQWAKETGIQVLGLPRALESKLESHGLVTLLSLLRLTPAKLATYKGLGEKTANQACAAAQEQAKAWHKHYAQELRNAA
jgi:hypothetical protein